MGRFAGAREIELNARNRISRLGSEGQLSYVFESWTSAPKDSSGTILTLRDLTTQDTFESDALVMLGEGSLIEAKFSTSHAAKITMQYREKNDQGTFDNWAALITDANAATGERKTTIRNENIGTDALRAGTQFRLIVTDAVDLVTTPDPDITMDLKASILYCNI